MRSDQDRWAGPPLAASAAGWAAPSGETWYTPVPAAADLSGHLATTWQARLGGQLRLVPDGCVDVLWVGNGTAWVCGPETSAWTFRLPTATPVYGVRFRPGRAGVALGVDVQELYDRRLELSDVLGGRAGRHLVEQVGEARDATAGLAAFQRAVRGWVAGSPEPGPVAGTLPRLLAARPGITVAEVAAELALGDRQLHRQCVRAFGYGPATLRRILRLQRFLALARGSGAGADLACLAVAAGYTDQPHLSRDCRMIAGASPAELAGRRPGGTGRRDRVRSVHDGAPGRDPYLAA